ncbi:6199_t:CDS:2, partial [Ambispora leptoticha]
MFSNKIQTASINKKSITSKQKLTSHTNTIATAMIHKVSKTKNFHKKNDSGFSEEFFHPILIDSKSNVPYSNCLGLNDTLYRSTIIHSKKKGHLVYSTDPKLNAWFRAPLEIALKWKGFAPEAQFRTLCRTTSNKKSTTVNVKNANLAREVIIKKFVKLECDTIYLEARARVIARRWATRKNVILNAEKRIQSVRNERKQLTTRDDSDAGFELEEKLGWKRIETFRKSLSQTNFTNTKVIKDIDFYLEELEGWSRIESFKFDLSHHKATLESQKLNYRQQIVV